LKDSIRQNIHLILHNATYSHAQKRKAIDFLIKLDEIAKHVNPKLAPDDLPRVGHRTTPDTTGDPDQLPKFPKTYNEMIAQAETVILPEEIPRRYFPPEAKPKASAFEY